MAGLEPAASCSRSMRSTKLSHIPMRPWHAVLRGGWSYQGLARFHRLPTVYGRRYLPRGRRGPGENRTPCLSRARGALYQVSYEPKWSTLPRPLLQSALAIKMAALPPRCSWRCVTLQVPQSNAGRYAGWLLPVCANRPSPASPTAGVEPAPPYKSVQPPHRVGTSL
jgi:hypothetical protein